MHPCSNNDTLDKSADDISQKPSEHDISIDQNFPRNNQIRNTSAIDITGMSQD